MRVFVEGAGVVTVAGSSLPGIWEAVHARRECSICTQEAGGGEWPLLRVPEEILGSLASVQRLRRSGRVSLLATAAAQQAVLAANLPEDAMRDVPVVFVTSDGGVTYSRRFFQGLIGSGPGSGSPLLFPETVYNAPASHVAALLGTNAESLTLVGDATAAVGALARASAMLDANETSRVLVVAANEADPVACAGYAQWGMVRGPKGMGNVLADCGAAILLGRGQGWVQVSHLTEARPLADVGRLAEALRELRLAGACRSGDWRAVACGASPWESLEAGSFADTQAVNFKPVLGESFAAGVLSWVALLAWRLTQPSHPEGAFVPAASFSGSLAALRLTCNKTKG
jgi:hypothetical protein